jgi:uncharacterized membrane protein YraQ (UPF0718 family)
LQLTIQDFLLRFQSVLWEAMPFIVLGAVVAGILEEFLPQEAISKVLPKSVLPSVMIGAVLGLVFPMCECGIVVVMRRLLRKGLPLSCCIAYMLAGPIINLVVIGSTWVAFYKHGIAREMVGLRVGLGFAVAVITALIVHIQYRKYGNALLTPLAVPPQAPTAADGQDRPFSDRVIDLFDWCGSALVYLVRFKWVRSEWAWWIIAGLVATGLIVAKWTLWQEATSGTSWMDELLSFYVDLFPVLLGIRLVILAVRHKESVKRFVTQRLPNISATALHDFVDITVFLILGAVLAALARSYITSEQIESLSRNQPYLAIPAMMFLAVMMCLCSEADAFVAASFTKMHLSAKVAFLVLGPMLDLKLLMMFTRVFRTRLIVTIVTCVVLLTLIFSVLLHLVYQLNGWTGLPPGA